jgi:hypothetical protein
MRKRFYQAGRIVAGLLVVVFAMTGAAKLADQVVTWLTFAVWQPFTIADALRFWSIPAPHAPKILGLHQITDARPRVAGHSGVSFARRRLPVRLCTD